MGFYVRKSVKAGPFRLNLSKSGLGISGGVRGFRIGTGPRGSYVHMGRNGVYYRSAYYRGDRRGDPPPAPHPHPSEDVLPRVGDAVMQEVQGATVLQMEAASSSELIRHLNEAAARSRLNPLTWLRGQRAHAVFYEVNDTVAQAFEGFVGAFDALSRCGAAWYVTAQGTLESSQNQKVNAGASSLVERSPLTFTRDAPKPLATNVVVPGMVSQGRSVHFLPDQLLVREGKHFAGVGYRDLHAELCSTPFVGSGRVPSDSERVGLTWKYVNKSGGPDKRFKDNRQLPVLAYAELSLESGAGLHTVFQFSNVGLAQSFVEQLGKLH